MKIGFIGLGIMGESMCENIVKKHDDKVYCFDINNEQVRKLEKIGAIPCESNKELAKASDCIISMVPKSEHVLGLYEEIKDELVKGKIWIDMSTIDPSVSKEISIKVKSAGAEFADSPVVKSKPAAINGTLGIYVGCDISLYDIIKPILSYMGSNIIRMGDNGMGLVMKVCHNTLVAEIQNGVNETINLAKSYGIEIQDFATAIGYGGGQNFYLDGQWKNLDSENWTTAFSIENMYKDLGICHNMSKEKGFPMPGMENALSVYDKCVKEKIGKEDFRATFKAVRGDYDDRKTE